MNSRYLLDTNILSHMMRDIDGTASRKFREVASDELAHAIYTSVVVDCELQFGLNRKPNERLSRAYERIITAVDVLPLDEQIAPHYARLRTALEAAGTPIGPNDALIAAHALALDAILVSADTEFERIPGLKVENWLAAQPAGPLA